MTLLLTCSLNSYLSFQLESLNVLPVVEHLDGTSMNAMWTDYDKLSVKILSYLMEVTLKCSKFRALDFGHRHIALDQTIESLKFGQALNSLSFTRKLF